ncbi:hypothetical protein GCM10009127_03150 [Alteraurantiacibacter aestuarii]
MDFKMVPEASEMPRINLVMPALTAGSDFGGVSTGIELFLRLVRDLRASCQIDMRLIVTDYTTQSDPGIFTRRAEKAGETVSPEDISLVRSSSDNITVRKNDIFFTYNWWTTLNIQKLIDQQTVHFGRSPLPLIYLMQDYEPMFHEFSSSHMLAREALDTVPRLWTILNSSNLKNFVDLLGHRMERSFVFEPVVSGSLRPYLGMVPASQREKKILVYGRPTVERNCFPALVRGLRRWARDYPEYADWEIISAGTEHPPVPLVGDREIRSVGKLSLDDYADTLLKCSVGVSLMASPHPSYPPLEMAHFGLRTITNTYACKDLSSFHGNIVSVRSIAEEPLAAAIAQACASYGQPVSDEGNAEYLREDSYPFLAQLVAEITAELA